ncbi:MAG: family 10 glycosylhydrolase [bacterium]
MQTPASAPLASPPAVPREFRGAWITPIWDRGFRDWPSAPGLSPDSQRAELLSTLDHAAAIGLNAVILHVRLAGDALYPTEYAPWSAFLSSRQGEAPSPAYDPLTFAVQEAHARGLQLHAWFNPFRAVLPIFAGKAAASHVTRKHPEWIRKYGSQTWIDPGDPAARKFVLETILDVVKRYDVDGVHIDDYFYPYRESRTITRRVRGKRVRERRDIEFPDDKTWKKYGKARGFTDRDAWRRSNIDDFIQTLYSRVKAIEPATLVGISPFGIWRSGTPPGVTGLDAFGEIYADSKRWLTEGWMDYMAPQLYWQLSGTEGRFLALDAWWRTVNPQRRYIWPALYTSHVYAGRDAWPISEIRAQIAAIRDTRVGTTDPPGHVHFRLAALFADGDRLANDLDSVTYSERALVPAFPWLGATPPASPIVTVVPNEGPMAFTITRGDTTRVRWWLIQTHGASGQWTTTLRPAGTGQMAASAFGTADPDEVAVTAIGVAGMASVPTLVGPWRAPSAPPRSR